MRTLAEVAAGVFVATAVRDTTTSTVLVHGDDALLVDPAWDPAELDGLAQWLRDRGLTVRAGFATHAHHDHVLWHPDFGAGPRWASTVTADIAERHRQRLVDELGPDWPPELATLVGRLAPTDGPVLDWPDRVELVRHDAHTPGHTALWLPAPRVLIAGDMLSDIEPPLPEETGPQEYRAGLQILRTYAEQAGIVIPGHGHVGTDAMRRWARDVALIGTS